MQGGLGGVASRFKMRVPQHAIDRQPHGQRNDGISQGYRSATNGAASWFERCHQEPPRSEGISPLLGSTGGRWTSANAESPLVRGSDFDVSGHDCFATLANFSEIESSSCLKVDAAINERSCALIQATSFVTDSLALDWKIARSVRGSS